MGRYDTLSGIFLSQADLEEWAGRKLTPADIDAIRTAIPNSTIPEAIGDIAFSIPHDDDENEDGVACLDCNVSPCECEECDGCGEIDCVCNEGDEDDEIGIGCTLCTGTDHVAKDCPERE